jgi:hypothetical protein
MSRRRSLVGAPTLVGLSVGAVAARTVVWRRVADRANRLVEDAELLSDHLEWDV